MSARHWLAAGVSLLSLGAHAQVADGWAGQQGGSSGGGKGPAVVVTTASQLRGAVESGVPVIEVAGIIDMRAGQPYANSADQGHRGAIRLNSNTTLKGAGSGSGLMHANVIVAKASNIIIRNLNFRNPCDVGPVWDPADGAKGNWNSLFDAITVSGSTHVWIDHNSFTDAPHGDELAPIENGMLKQCHDGALDINQGSDLITVSYNRFALHKKNGLVGSSDKAVGDIGRLHVTFSNNLFENVSSRTPRVRFGQVHLYNNYHVGDRHRAVYPHEYSVGVGKQADIIGEANVYDIAGARSCADIVHSYGTDGSFADRGSLLNGGPLGACIQTAAPAWQVPYPFKARPAAEVREHVLANAGAGNWQMDSSSDGGVVALAAGVVPPAGDYFIEARIRAVLPAIASGQLYLVGGQNGAGLSIANGILEVNLGRLQDRSMTRIKQLRRMPASPERWNLVRLEAIGTTLTAYLNGEALGSAQVPPAAGAPGAVGFYSKGNAFEIDGLRTGAAAEKPARIAVSLAGTHVRLQAGDAPYPLAVSALAGDGVGRLAFTAVSSDPAIAGVSASPAGIMISARRAGTASILLAGVANPALQATVSVAVGPGFVMPSGAVTHVVYPPDKAHAVPVDTPLRIDLEAPAVLSEAGSVRIYRKRDMALVDVIHAGDEVVALGPVGLQRHVLRPSIKANGNSVTVRPHAGALAYDTEYVVALGAGVAGAASGRWSFSTRKAPPAGASVTVDDDGPADFRTVQGALDHAMTRDRRDAPLTINIRNGSYNELLFLRSRDRLTVRGESRDGVLIHATNNEGINPGSGASQGAGAPGASGGRALLLVEDADLLTLTGLTLQNTTQRRNTLSGQAETLHFNSDSGRLVAHDASFISEQDTRQLKGYAWFYRTLVAGNVDFIWGANRVALFEQSEIRSIGDSANADSGGYIVQARTVTGADKGFVFVDSTLTQGPGPAGNTIARGRTSLARSPGTASTWDTVAFINCRMDSHIASEGWWGKPPPHPEFGWREFGSTDLAGQALDLSRRGAGHLLDAASVNQQYGSRAIIFSAFDGGKGWNPASGSP